MKNTRDLMNGISLIIFLILNSYAMALDSAQYTAELIKSGFSDKRPIDQSVRDKVSDGISSGGGTVAIFSDGRAELIDLIMFNPEFRSKSSPAGPDFFKTDQPNFFTVVGYSNVDSEKLASHPAMVYLKDRLTQWTTNKGSYIIAKMLLDELKYAKMTYSNSEFAISCHKVSYQRALEIELQQTGMEFKPVAVFNPMYGAMISMPLWKKMGLESQAGLLLHEVLRKIQVNYKQDINNRTIIEITAAILTVDPKSEVALDQHPGMGHYFKSRVRGIKDDGTVDQICNEIRKHKFLASAKSACDGNPTPFDAPPEPFPRYLDLGGELTPEEVESRKLDAFLDDLKARVDSVAFSFSDDISEQNRETAFSISQSITSYNLQRAINSFKGRTQEFVKLMTALAHTFYGYSSGEGFIEDYLKGELKAEKSSDQSELNEAAKKLTCVHHLSWKENLEFSYCGVGEDQVPKINAKITANCENPENVIGELLKETKASSGSGWGSWFSGSANDNQSDFEKRLQERNDR